MSTSFRELYDSHAGYILSSLRRLGVRSADVEDVAHEVFVAVHRHLNERDPERAIKPWLFAFAAKCAANYRRHSIRRHEQFETNGNVAVLADRNSHQRGAGDEEAKHVAREERDLVLRVLDAIEDDKRELLILHDIDGVSMPEIAAALAIPLNTAYSRLRLARRAFEDRLTRESKLPPTLLERSAR